MKEVVIVDGKADFEAAQEVITEGVAPRGGWSGSPGWGLSDGK